jgi:L-alanine-DL-glutamate epimerase-like enolase superfamily enzyme
MNRRSFFSKTVAAAAASSFWPDKTLGALTQNVNTASKPSELKITDMRIATIVRAPMRDPLIRIDTNQGIYGLGEVRDGASKNYALMLKSRLLGENPCNVEKIFRKIKQFGNHGRLGGGVCGVEMALMDLAGKAYNVPAYQLLGGKYRDKIRLYADTDESHDPKIFGERLRKRRDENGFTWLKMDLGVDLLEGQPGTVAMPVGSTLQQSGRIVHMNTGIELTPKGVEAMAAFVGQIREIIGMETPLAADHFGHIGLNSCIRLGKALERYNMAWLEDMVPWQYPELLKQIHDEVDIPVLTGEDIYLVEGFQKLCEMHAVDMIHPDLATSGGLMETKRIGDMAQGYGVPMAMHFAGSPVSFMANVHTAAATENFVVLEHHGVDVPWWSSVINEKVYDHGWGIVPDRPGLGITLNEDTIKQHLDPNDPGYFEPTPQWDRLDSWDRTWS